MKRHRPLWLGGVVASAMMIVGCQNSDYEYNDERLDTTPSAQRTSTASESVRSDPKMSQPYSPIKGQTTGDGMRTDMRTGGTITGTDVTRHERIEGNRSINTDNFSGDGSAVPTRPGTGSGGLSSPTGVPGGTGGSPQGGVGSGAPSSGVAPGQ